VAIAGDGDDAQYHGGIVSRQSRRRLRSDGGSFGGVPGDGSV
jgi:hypothetical protein